MEVFRYSGSCHFAHIQANVEACWLHYLIQKPQALLDDIEMLLCFLFRQVLQIGDMPIRGNHQMPWVIWEGIHDYEILLITIKDEIRLVAIFPRFLAQDTTSLPVSFYVFHSPGCPKILHWTHIVC